ncbi:MAG TPA: class I SAM-dependent methyltransferase, partial [Micromonospora sp.]
MRLRPWFYNTLYRFNIAPWDNKEVRPQLYDLVSQGRLTPKELPTVLDLGCGTGAEAVFLAMKGFRPVVGVDFSAVALRRARARAEAAAVADRCSFLQADVT